MAYNNKTVKQLKDICEDRRLSLKGVKANLIDRLGRNDNDEVEEGKECSICDEVRATEFFGPPPHDHIDKSAMAAQEQVCGFCWEDHILSRLSDAVPCEDITCMFCEAPLTQAEVRQLLGNKNRGYQVYLGTETWSAHLWDPAFRFCEEPRCSEGGAIEGLDGAECKCTTFNCRWDGTGHLNCLPCKTVHKPGETCKAYRATQGIRSTIDEASRILRDQIAKPCPKCGAYVSNSGCHQIKCIGSVKMGKGLPQICGHVYCYDCGKKRNGKDGYDKTGHEDGCPHDVGVKAARKEALGSKRKREIAEEEVEE